MQALVYHSTAALKVVFEGATVTAPILAADAPALDGI